ncbi:unnamed protein product [Phaeothamnion confervicola]
MDEGLRHTDGFKRWSAFASAFHTLRESFLASKEVERRLIARCEEIKAELVDSGTRLQLALLVRAEDERTMARLRRETEASLRTAKLAQRKEKDAREVALQLKAECDQLRAQVGSSVLDEG